MSEREKLKLSTRAMYDEFKRQNVPVRIIDAPSSLLEFIDITGEKRLIFSTSSDKSSGAGFIIGNNKQRTEIIARELNISVPIDTICLSFDDALQFFNQHAPIVLKPLDNSGGSGVGTNIKDIETLKKAYAYAREYGEKVIAQQHINGTDIRLLVVAGTFRSALERRPAHVTGDGVSAYSELIRAENTSGKRMSSSLGSLDPIDSNGAELFLGDLLDTVPKKDQEVFVIGPANLSLGGTAHEATDRVTPAMIADAEKITRKLKLGLCGVDMLWDQEKDAYYLIEVNAIPSINMHNEIRWGTSSDAIIHYVKWLIDPALPMAS